MNENYICSNYGEALILKMMFETSIDESLLSKKYSDFLIHRNKAYRIAKCLKSYLDKNNLSYSDIECLFEDSPELFETVLKEGEINEI